MKAIKHQVKAKITFSIQAHGFQNLYGSSENHDIYQRRDQNHFFYNHVVCQRQIVSGWNSVSRIQMSGFEKLWVEIKKRGQKKQEFFTFSIESSLQRVQLTQSNHFSDLMNYED